MIFENFELKEQAFDLFVKIFHKHLIIDTRKDFSL
jgi:hypothetical protein